MLRIYHWKNGYWISIDDNRVKKKIIYFLKVNLNFKVPFSHFDENKISDWFSKCDRIWIDVSENI